MCTLVILHRPGHHWPLLLGANRDEQRARRWLAPGRHWPDRPELLGGLDCLAGGSWLAVSDRGVLATVTNRPGRSGPSVQRRSRGTLVLTALKHGCAADAAAAIAALCMLPYEPFNLLVADAAGAWCVSHREPGAACDAPVVLPPGLVMLSNGDPNDPASPRIRHYLPQFLAAPAPDPELGDWSAWERLLASRHAGAGGGSPVAVNVSQGEFGTVSSSLIAMPVQDWPGRGVWRFAAAAPHLAPFLPVPH